MSAGPTRARQLAPWLLLVAGWAAAALRLATASEGRAEPSARLVVVTAATLVVVQHLPALRTRWLAVGAGAAFLVYVLRNSSPALSAIGAGTLVGATFLSRGAPWPRLVDPRPLDSSPEEDRDTGRPRLDATPHTHGWLAPLGVWVTTTLVLTWLSFSAGDGGIWPTRGRLQWDYWVYRRVAEGGYPDDDGGLEAVFPGFPLLLRILGPIVGDTGRAAVFLAWASGAGATVLFWRWIAAVGLEGRSRWLALALFSLYPYTQSLYGAGYADSLALALAIGAALLVERDRLVLAGLVGGCATFTRPNALPLIIALFVLGLERTGVVRARLVGRERRENRAPLDVFWHVRVDGANARWRNLAPLASISGVAAYSAWLLGTRGDPLYFWSVQVGAWSHQPVTWVSNWFRLPFLARIDDWFGSVSWWTVFDEVLATAAFALAVSSVPALARRLGIGYGLLVAGIAVIPFLASDGFMTPGGRLLLMSFPIPALLGERLSRRPVLAVAIVATAGASLVVATRGFALNACCW